MIGAILKVDINSTSLVKEVFKLSEDYMLGLNSIGIGVASVIFLILVIYYISNILQGGKFQVKMLLPVLIYVLVCNFKLVTLPVTAFITRLQYECVKACEDSSDEQLRKYIKTFNLTKSELKELAHNDTGDLTDVSINISDAFKAIYRHRAKESRNEKIQKQYSKLESTFQAELEVDLKEASSKRDSVRAERKYERLSSFVSFMEKVSEGFDNIDPIGNKIYRQALFGLTGIGGVMGASVGSAKGRDEIALSIKGVFLTIFGWICDVLAFALKIMGAVMIAVIVAFGPITWAFALFPGNGKFIVSWFLRLCQFSLYSPIVALIRSLGNGVFISLCSDKATFSSWIMIFGVLVCIIVLLTCVPTIASMIIEGATGAISLTSGLQSMSSAMGAAGAVVAAPVKAGVALGTGHPEALLGLGNMVDRKGGGGGGSQPSSGQAGSQNG